MTNSDYGHLPLGDNEEPPKKKKLVGWWPMIFVMSGMAVITIVLTFGSQIVEVFKKIF